MPGKRTEQTKGEPEMKKLVSLLLSLMLVCLLAPAAMADATVNAVVQPGGMYANTITVTLDDTAYANYYYEYHVEVVGRNGNTPLTVHRADYVDNTVTLHVDEFSAGSSLIVKCVDTFDPDAEPAGSSGGRGGNRGAAADEPEEEAKEEKIVFNFEGDQVKVGVALEDKFAWGSGSFQYTKVVDDKEETLEQEYVYRLFTPENAEGDVPLVVTIHGSGECGTDGLKMLTANGLNMCWADPAWQKDHPCYILALQCPNADFSNIEPQRSQWVDEIDRLVRQMKEELHPSKMYLATLSMGSRLTFHLLDLHPDVPFDACLTACGRANEADISDVVRPAMYLVHDSNDPVNKTELGIEAYNILKENGHENVRFTLSYMGFGHGIWTYVYDVQNPEFMEWLFQQ